MYGFLRHISPNLKVMFGPSLTFLSHSLANVTDFSAAAIKCRPVFRFCVVNDLLGF